MDKLAFLVALAKGQKELLVGKDVRFQWDHLEEFGGVMLNEQGCVISGVIPQGEIAYLHGKVADVTTLGGYDFLLIVMFKPNCGFVVDLKRVVTGLTEIND